MTSLYGVTKYFDYGYLEEIVYGRSFASDDCSRRGCAPPPVVSSQDGGGACDQRVVETTPIGIGGWLREHAPRWYELMVRARLSYVIDTDLTARTFFLPPDEAIEWYGIDRWSYGHLRRLFTRLIIDRPLSPAYLKRSLGYKLYTFENYDPVYIFSHDGTRYFYQDESVEIILDKPGSSIAVPIRGRVHAGYRNAALTTHWIHRLSTIPSVECPTTVYAD